MQIPDRVFDVARIMCRHDADQSAKCPRRHMCRWNQLLNDVPDCRLELRLDAVGPHLFPGFESWLLRRLHGPLVRICQAALSMTLTSSSLKRTLRKRHLRLGRITTFSFRRRLQRNLLILSSRISS